MSVNGMYMCMGRWIDGWMYGSNQSGGMEVCREGEPEGGMLGEINMGNVVLKGFILFYNGLDKFSTECGNGDDRTK